jgi:hypothetical protein
MSSRLGGERLHLEPEVKFDQPGIGSVRRKRALTLGDLQRRRRCLINDTNRDLSVPAISRDIRRIPSSRERGDHHERGYQLNQRSENEPDPGAQPYVAGPSHAAARG